MVKGRRFACYVMEDHCVCMVNRDTGVLRVEGAHCALTRSKKAGVCIVEGVEFVDMVRSDASAPIAKNEHQSRVKKYPLEV